MNIKIIESNSKDHFREIARLHSDGITEGFLSTLGIPFLTRLYMGISKEKNSGVLVAVEEGGEDGGSVSQLDSAKENILGFISYSKDVKSCYKHVMFSNCFSLGVAMIPNIFKPTIYKKIFETLIYPFAHKDIPEEIVEDKANPLRSELLSMAVSENARGKGIGKLLVKAVDEAMLRMDVNGYYVVTHGIDERSNGFYQRCGFEKVREFENHGKPMNEYFKSVSRLMVDG